MYEQRAPLYARFADAVVDNDGTPEETVEKILSVLGMEIFFKVRNPFDKQ